MRCALSNDKASFRSGTAMNAAMRWLSRTRTALRPGVTERDMRREMEGHIEMEIESLMRDGVAPTEARRRALASFGGVERFVEEARDAWPLRFIHSVIQDLRFAVRSLRRSPSFTSAAVLALALGISGNTVVFSAVDSVALRPLAVHAPDQLVAMYGTQGNATLLSFSYATYQDFRREMHSVSDIAAVTEGAVTLGTNGDVSVVWAGHVSDNYFTMLGVPAEQGQLIHQGQLREPVAVLSYALWASRFNKSESVVGQTLRVNGTPFTIVGVAPRQFNGTRLFTFEPSVWLPAGMYAQTMPASGDLLASRDASRLLLIGRLKDGVGLAQAEGDANAVARSLAHAYPDTYRSLTTQLVSNRTPINPWLAPPSQIRLIGLLSMLGIGLVLLIACANVASLLLARMIARRQEVATRLSLGASRARLLQQLLTESVVLAVASAAVSIPVTMLGMRLLLRLTPRLDFASSWRPADGVRVFTFSALLAFGAAVLFGLAPSLQSLDERIALGLRQSAGVPRRWRPKLREALVVGQVALSVVVLITALLFVRSLDAARTLDTGLATTGAAVVTLDPALLPTYDSARTRTFYSRLEARLRELPAVSVVARATSVPLDGSGGTRRVLAEGSTDEFERVPVAEYGLVTPGFFASLGTPIVAGREFVSADTASPDHVAVINEVLAKRFWPDEPAVGKLLRLESPTGPLVRVIGVARSTRYRSLGELPRSAMWLDLERAPRSRTVLIVRGTSGDVALIDAVRAAVHDVDPSLPLIGLGTLRDHISVAYTAVESGAVSAASFALVAVLLAASGIYGLVSYSVSLRRREIALRIALGASSRAVMQLAVSRAVLVTFIGAAIGLAVVMTVPMGLGKILYGVSPRDPVTAAGACVLFCGIAALAAFVPSYRAARLDPMQVLRTE
jgi:predicted permease